MTVSKLLFLPALCWGYIWMSEVFVYPELWLYAGCAAMTGIGFALMRLLPEKFRAAGEFISLLALLLLPESDFRMMLVPLVWGGALANSLFAAPDEWKNSRRMCGGFLLGAMLTVIPGIPYFCFPGMLLLIAAWQIGSWKVKLPAILAALSAVVLMWDLLPAKEHRSLPPGAVISAFAQVTPATHESRIFLAGGDELLMRRNAVELLPAAQLSYIRSFTGKHRKADLIIAETLPAVSDGGIYALSNALNPGGVLVIPVEWCGALPHWQWLILPGSNGTHAMGVHGRKLFTDPDKMDENLARNFRGRENFAPLPGALAGMLCSWHWQAPEMRKSSDDRQLWGIMLLVSSLVLGGYIFFRTARQMENSEFFRMILNDGGYIFSAAVIIPVLAESINYPGMLQLFTALTVLWFIRRPATDRKRFSRMQGVVAAAALLMALNGNWVWLIAALVCGGYACAELDHELGQHIPEVELLRCFAIAAGIVAAWAAIEYLPVTYQLVFASGLRFYSWFRN